MGPDLSFNFTEMVDNSGLPYFSVDATTIPVNQLPRNATQAVSDICSFLSESMVITPIATGRFSTDLTAHDDLLIAFLSLLLLFCIDALLAAVLLRTRSRGRVSQFSLSVKHFVDLAKELRWRRLLSGARGEGGKRGGSRGGGGGGWRWLRANFRLLSTGGAVLLFTIGLEVVVLVCSSESELNVTNRDASFSIAEVVMPDWNEIAEKLDTAATRPCAAISLEGVRQGGTQINACMSADRQMSFLPFSKTNKVVNVSIVSDLHEYGTEHIFDIDGQSTALCARAYFFLADVRQRMLPARSSSARTDLPVAFIHRQMIAYMFSRYARDTNDTSMNLQRLNDISFSFAVEPGPVVDIIQFNRLQRFKQVASVRHTTRLEAIAPTGDAAITFAQAVLRASIGVQVEGPDPVDLLMGSGSVFEVESTMWTEASRQLNSVSLFILVAITMALGWILRSSFQPLSSIEIAAARVFQARGVEVDQAPLYFDEREDAEFGVLSGAAVSTSLESYDAEGSDGGMPSYDLPFT